MTEIIRLMEEIYLINENNERTYSNIQKITNGHGDDYATGFLLDYPYFIKHK